MAVGAEFYTDSGVVQIDDQAPVLCLRYMGSSTVVNRHPASTNSSSNLAYTVDIAVTAETPQIYVKGEAEGAAFAVIATVKSGNSWTFRVIGMGHSPRFSYFIYDKPPQSSSGAGFEVFDANGQVMFSSLYRPMDVKGFNFNDTQGNPDTINLTGGRQYAVAFNARITRTEWDDNQTNGDTLSYWTDYLNIASVNGGTISATALAIAGGSTNGGQGSPPIGTGLGGWGSPSTMTVVDVTGLVSAVTPASPIVSVSPTSLTVTGTGSGNTTTGIVTATASGGSGAGYAYQWVQTLTDARVVAVGATNTRTLQTQVVNQTAGTTIVTRWQCKVTDSAGNVGFSDEVTMTHVQAGSYTTPNPISIPTLSVVSNEYLANTSAGYFQITGINQPISLKFTRDSLTGNLFGRALLVGVADVGAGSGGPWTYYRVGALSTGLQIDNIQNGRWFSVFGELQTDSGVRTGAWQNYVTNVTTGVQLASFRIEGTVDADNNYNVPDYTPDALSFPNQTINTNDYYGGFGISKTITGINQTITIRANVSNRSGNISAGGCYFRKNGVDQGSGMLWTAGDDARQGTFVNGDVMEIFIDAQTFSGAKSGQFYTTITVVETGVVIGGFWTVCDVDQDNNYQVVDTAPDTIANWPTINGVVNEEDYEWSTSWSGDHYVTGINAPITVRFQAYGYYNPDGQINRADINVFTWPPGAGGWTHRGSFNAMTTGYLDIPNIVNGTKVAMNPRIATSGGRATANIQLVMWSMTGASATLFANTTHSFTVDNDNNFFDRTPNAIYTPPMSFYSDSGYGGFWSPFSITGINAPITLGVYISGVTNGLSDGYFYVTDAGGSPIASHHYPSGDGSFTFSATNGQSFQFYCDGVSIRLASCSFTVTLKNESTGAIMNTFTVSGTVRTTGGGGGPGDIDP